MQRKAYRLKAGNVRNLKIITENLPDPDVLADEIVESLQAALAQFESIAEELGEIDEDKE